LVAAIGVEGENPEEFTGVGLDDPDVQIFDEPGDSCS
jgi:hypothetical protein